MNPGYMQEPELTQSIKWSFFAHLFLLVVFILKDWVFPSKPIVFNPAIRVDLVALPDKLKREIVLTQKAESETDETEKPLREDPDEMGLKSKRESKMKNALKRIQAIENLKNQPADQKILGNQLSSGSSLEGDTNTGTTSYPDLLLSRVKEHWNLPIWLERQNLSAQVTVFLNARGRIVDLKFKKFSGNPSFDDAVKQAILDSDPFPMPPPEFRRALLINGILLGFPL